MARSDRRRLSARETELVGGAAIAAVGGLAAIAALTFLLPPVSASPFTGSMRPYVTVTSKGPRDGGDFGPGTTGTYTSGIQEALDTGKTVHLDGNFITDREIQISSSRRAIFGNGKGLSSITQRAGTAFPHGTIYMKGGGANPPADNINFEEFHSLTIDANGNANPGLFGETTGNVLLDNVDVRNGASPLGTVYCGFACLYWELSNGRVDTIGGRDNVNAIVITGNVDWVHLSDMFVVADPAQPNTNGVVITQGGLVQARGCHMQSGAYAVLIDRAAKNSIVDNGNLIGGIMSKACIGLLGNSNNNLISNNLLQPDLACSQPACLEDPTCSLNQFQGNHITNYFGHSTVGAGAGTIVSGNLGLV